MRVRLATHDDLPAIVAIYNQAVVERATADLEPVTVEDRAPWFAAHAPDRRPVWVAEVDESVVGWCSLSDHRPGRAATRHTAEISYYVDQAHRRRGVASALIQSALDGAPGCGVEVLFAIVLADNAASLALLTRFGFEPWGVLPGAADLDGRRVDHRYLGRKVAPA
jgi:phosphinothricin acetyltransferase